MMTREEACVLLKMMFAFWANTHERTNVEMEMALNVALSALRPVSREQVEKVWRGEWELNKERSSLHVEKIYLCTRCKNFEAWGETEKTNFCGYCGAPMTDEAVQMVMERLEALKDD